MCFRWLSFLYRSRIEWYRMSAERLVFVSLICKHNVFSALVMLLSSLLHSSSFTSSSLVCDWYVCQFLDVSPSSSNDTSAL